MRKLALAAFAAVIVVPSIASAQSDSVIKQRIIDADRAAYKGACPCPYDTARDGSQCGGRSAYAKAGGIKCFPRDVTAAEVRAYRQGR